MISELHIVFLMIICFLFSIFVFNLDFFCFLDEYNKKNNNQIEGWRYILSFCVVFCHYVFSYYFVNNNMWIAPGYNFTCNLGAFGVSQFFMITSYLFWGRNFSDSKEYIKMIIKRYFRIFPISFISSFLCIIISIISIISNKNFSHASINLTNILWWFDAGSVNYRPDFSEFKKSRFINAGVTWTLHWEWIFYFILPLVCFFRNIFSIFIIILIYTFLSFENICQSIGLCFLGGALTIYIPKYKFSKIWFIFLVFLCFYIGKQAISLETIPFGCMLFYIISNNENKFKILNIKSIKRMGRISYSIYLIHGILWFIMFKFLKLLKASFIFFDLLTIITFMLILFFSAFLYYKVEKPFMEIGKKLASKIGQSKAQSYLEGSKNR